MTPTDLEQAKIDIEFIIDLIALVLNYAKQTGNEELEKRVRDYLKEHTDERI